MGLKVRTIGIVLSMMAAAVEVARSQELPRPMFPAAGDTLSRSSLSFERVLNTFFWNGRVVYAADLGGTRLSTSQSVRSRLIRSDQRTAQDEYGGGTYLRVPLGSLWWMRAQATSSVLSDSRAVDLAELALHQALAGMEYVSPTGIVGLALGGVEFNAQAEERDVGFMYLGSLEGRDLSLEEFRTSFRGRSSRSFIKPRTAGDDSLTVSIGRNFGVEASQALRLRYNAQRREFYSFADSTLQSLFGIRRNIFRRQARVFDVGNQLQYRPSSDVVLNLDLGMINRLIERGFRHKDFSSSRASALLDTRVEELSLFGSLSLNLRLYDRLSAAVRAMYREREERHSVVEDERAPDALVRQQTAAARRLGSVARQTSLAGTMEWRAGEKSVLNFAGSASILRYDTPDTLNTDDRDELLLTVGLEADHTAGPHLKVVLSADVMLSHLVYLHRSQSANNAWNRIVRFSPRVVYTPATWLRTVNIAEVLANYTVYDFEAQLAYVRSFSFRQASWYDSTVVRLSRMIDFEFVGGFRAYERGILRWEDFKERPEHFFLERSFWPRTVLHGGKGIRLSVGFRLFSQDRHRYEGSSRVFERRVQSSGPSVSVHWMHAEGYGVVIEGWSETQRDDHVAVRRVSNLALLVMFAL